MPVILKHSLQKSKSTLKKCLMTINETGLYIIPIVICLYRSVKHTRTICEVISKESGSPAGDSDVYKTYVVLALLDTRALSL